MTRRVFCIAGQAPTVKWKRNTGRKKRTIEEARAIAMAYGVRIPDDVEFVEAEPGELKGGWDDFFADGETARGPEVAPNKDGYVYWQQHYLTAGCFQGKILFRVHPEVLTSDEAIAGTFEHEMHELADFRDAFKHNNWRMWGDDYGYQVQGDYHFEAWDAADELVRRMREANK